MKTVEQLAKEQGLEGEEGVLEDNLKVQQDVLQSCFDLCKEGYKEFKRMNLMREAEGCDACAANIAELALQHSIKLKLN